MTYNIRFHFNSTSLVIQGVDETAKFRYARAMEFETPFVVTQPAIEDAWLNMPEREYIVNPNLVTYVEVTTRNV